MSDIPIMKSGGAETNKIIEVSREEKTVYCDTGTVDIYEYLGGSRSSTVSQTVSPGDPKTIYGRGSWDLVRSATSVNVYVK